MNIGDPVLRHCPSQSRRELAMVFGMNYAGGQRGPEALALSLWMTPQAQHHRGFLGVKTYTATQAGMGVGVTFRVLLALELRDLLHGGWTGVRAEVSAPPS